MPPANTFPPAKSQLSETDYLNRALSTVFSEEYLDIYEVTYAYATLPGGFFLNTTLFGRLVFGETYESELSNLEMNLPEIENLMLRARTKLEYVVAEAGSIREGLLASPGITPRSKLLVGALEEKIRILEMCLIGLPFEAEKAGLPHGLSDVEVERLTHEIESRDAATFHGMVRDNPREIRAALERCKKLIQASRTLKPDECAELLHLCEVVPDWSGIHIPTASHQMDVFEASTLARLVPRDRYIRVFETVFRIYGIDKPIREDERSSIYDGEDALYIPIAEKYDYLSIHKILGLVAHEIETHYLSADNNSKTLGFRAADNIFRDEGVAIVMETVLDGEDIESIPISENMILALYGEVLPGRQYRRFIELYFKSQNKLGAEEKFRRTKRNYSKTGRGVQHKDTTYSR